MMNRKNAFVRIAHEQVFVRAEGFLGPVIIWSWKTSRKDLELEARTTFSQTFFEVIVK